MFLPRHILIAGLITSVVGCNSQSTDNSASTNRGSNPTNASSAQNNSQQHIEKIAERLYLRGSFNLWGYHKQYQLLQIEPRTFAASAQLVKGQHYEFMFSAKDASKKNANCGYKKQQLLKSNQKYSANCNNVVLENFVFIPNESGVYEFFLELASINNPIVYIKKAY